jgi:hypothetical protein
VTRRVSVVVVSDNAGTLDGLCEYLRRAGLAAVGTRAWTDPVVEKARAVVGFPDDFGCRETIEAVTRLARSRPSLALVLITREPRSFALLARGRAGQAAEPLIIPKPAWGWTILDALRARLEA